MVVPTADRVGGYENQAKQLAANLASEGHLITVLTDRMNDLPDREFTDGYLVRRIPKNLFSLLRYFWQHRKSFEIVHAHGVTGFSVVAIRLAKFFGMPVILKPATAEDLNTVFKSLKFQDKLYQKWLKQTDVFVAISEELQAEMLSCGIEQAKIQRIPNSVDASRFIPAASNDRQQLRQEFQIPDGHFVFLFIGRLVKRKGVDILLPSWKDVTNATLWIVGDGPERHALQELAKTLRLQNVQFFGVASNTVSYYQAADFFVLPSLSEGFPGVLLEAMSSGLPCIATEIGGVSDIMKDGSHGIVVQPGSIPALTTALQSAFKSEAQLQQWREHCRKTAEEYDLQKISAIYQQMYASLAKA